MERFVGEIVRGELGHGNVLCVCESVGSANRIALADLTDIMGRFCDDVFNRACEDVGHVLPMFSVVLKPNPFVCLRFLTKLGVAFGSFKTFSPFKVCRDNMSDYKGNMLLSKPHVCS